MLKWIPVVLLAALASCQQPAFAAEWATADMNRHIDQTNFAVNSGCSGTLVDLPGRYVLTANHCVSDYYETIEREKIDDRGVVTKEKVRRLRPVTVKQIFFHGASEVREITYRTRIVAVDKEKDLAVLQVLTGLPNTIAAKLACANPVRGEPVFIVGNPMGVLYASVVPGMVASVQRDYGMIGTGDSESESLMQVSGGVVGGNSGGAVYNSRGELVGVPVMAHRVNEVVGFAAPLGVVKTFLRDAKLESVFGYCTAAP